jgi:hypothetical protein
MITQIALDATPPVGKKNEKTPVKQRFSRAGAQKSLATTALLCTLLLFIDYDENSGKTRSFFYMEGYGGNRNKPAR